MSSPTRVRITPERPVNIRTIERYYAAATCRAWKFKNTSSRIRPRSARRSWWSRVTLKPVDMFNAATTAAPMRGRSSTDQITAKHTGAHARGATLTYAGAFQTRELQFYVPPIGRCSTAEG